jgi:hypothetical protein
MMIYHNNLEYNSIIFKRKSVFYLFLDPHSYLNNNFSNLFIYFLSNHILNQLLKILSNFNL